MNNENFASLENVINPKSLERQIKIIEQRLTELQREMSALEQRREACQILLGVPVTPKGVIAEAAAPVVATKKTSRPKKKTTVEENFEAEDLENEDQEEVSVIRTSDLHGDNEPHETAN